MRHCERQFNVAQRSKARLVLPVVWLCQPEARHSDVGGAIFDLRPTATLRPRRAQRIGARLVHVRQIHLRVCREGDSPIAASRSRLQPPPTLEADKVVGWSKVFNFPGSDDDTCRIVGAHPLGAVDLLGHDVQVVHVLLGGEGGVPLRSLGEQADGGLAPKQVDSSVANAVLVVQLLHAVDERADSDVHGSGRVAGVKEELLLGLDEHVALLVEDLPAGLVVGEGVRLKRVDVRVAHARAVVDLGRVRRGSPPALAEGVARV
mmetsp:Transcript_17479/g.39991  ORF Transcript_17479/g.39991 Transcript_17479/m.39991 type:complete len:262 (+) Transcript_17479:119-904(+)